MLYKPTGCDGCALQHLGTGFSNPSGPIHADILLVGEALGEQEVKAGRPFVGPAGQVLDRILQRAGFDREAVRVDNAIRCRPPNNELVGKPYEHAALAHCRYVDETLREPHKVVVALGATATRRLLGLSKERFSLNNWHGLPVETQWGWVIPTYHPSFIMQGNQKHISTVLFALNNAKEVVRSGWKKEDATLYIDPPPDQFRAWAATVTQDDWLAVDIETPEKAGKPEDEVQEGSADILRINFATRPDEGYTVPWHGQYLDTIQQLLRRPGVQLYWNAAFDRPRLLANGMELGGLGYDFMWAWHVLQSDLPRGLAFVAPFYSRFGAWKHLSAEDPGRYAAIDAVQTVRVARGIEKDLQAAGQWQAFYRHVYELDQILQSATQIGLPVSKARLESFDKELATKQESYKAELEQHVPQEVLKLHPKGGWKRKPKNFPFKARFKRGDEKLEVDFREEDLIQREVEGEARWFVQEPFNPASPPQLLAVMQAKGHTAGRSKHSTNPSTNKKVLERLAKQDKFYQTILDNRAVSKVRNTYVSDTLARSQVDGRVHATFTHRPSTMRLSCMQPNLQNVVSDRSLDSPAVGFRRCVVASPRSYLVEADFSAIEAVETGWFSGDPHYIRLAKLGVHAYLTSHLVKQPADLNWSDTDLGKYFREIKKKFHLDYEKAKRVVHGTSYGLTPDGMVNNYPELFTRKSASAVQDLFFSLCPKLKEWQKSVRDTAHRLHCLGGSSHPYHYRHWFWDVYTYRNGNWVLGKDGNRVVSYYPQSTAAGVLYDAVLELSNPGSPNYIGDIYEGKTPIRALIHDSILMEVPKESLDKCLQATYRVMTDELQAQPLPLSWNMGKYLTIGVAIKVGKSWAGMEEVDPELGVASDTALYEEESLEED